MTGLAVILICYAVGLLAIWRWPLPARKNLARTNAGVSTKLERQFLRDASREWGIVCPQCSHKGRKACRR